MFLFTLTIHRLRADNKKRAWELLFLQILWTMHAFFRLMGNWMGIGRIDKILDPYLKKDLRKGTITLDEAREILAHFWINGTEWIGHHKYIFGASGDAQFYLQLGNL